MYDGESVLLGRKGTIDRPLYVQGRFWTVDTMYWTKVLPGVNGRFAYYSARTIPFEYYATNTALPSMTKGSLNAHLVALPSIEEQNSIVSFLDRETAKIDALIAEQQRLMELLQEKRQAVISHAVIKGLNPDAPMKPSGVEWLGDVPAHWEVTRFGQLFREVVEPGTDDLPILSVSIHHGVSDDELPEAELDRKVTRSEDRSKYKRVEPGDLVYNMMRAWQGGFGTVAVPGMVSPAYVVARPRLNSLTGFIELVLRTPQAIEQMRRYSKGVTDFRLRLYWDEFKNIRVGLPNLDEARTICEMVSAMDEKCSDIRSACEASIALLSERRTVLISAAVTGQIDARASAA
jgi:type I restriction enzyme S subunit